MGAAPQPAEVPEVASPCHFGSEAKPTPELGGDRERELEMQLDEATRLLTAAKRESENLRGFYEGKSQ